MRTLFHLYALSGLFSLAYQVCWLRHFTDRFGSSTFTFVLVLCCFIGGLGAGALASERVTGIFRARLRGRSDLAVYGAVEVAIALSVLLTFVESLLPVSILGAFPYRAVDGIFEPTLAYQAAKVPIAALSILVPCFLMGVTFPLLCNVFVERRRFPAALYAWNTLGACTAVLLCEWVLIRYLGTDATLVAVLLANLGLGLYFVARGGALLERCRGEAPEPVATAGRATDERPSGGTLLAVACLSGFLSGAIEADAFRRIHFIQVYNGAAMAYVSFWSILAIFVGSWLVDALRGLRLVHLKAIALAGFGVYLATTRLGLNAISRWMHSYAGTVELGTSFDPEGTLRILGVIWLAVGCAVFPTYLCLSLFLPYACNQAQAQGRHLGRLYGWNTVAFLLGMIAFSSIAPQVNLFYAFELLTMVFGVLVAVLLLLSPRGPFRKALAGAAGVAIVAATLQASREFQHDYFPEGTALHSAQIRALKGSAGFSTFVAELPAGDAVFLDTGQMSGTAKRSRAYMKLMAHLPLLANPEPRQALLICFGVGNTGSALAKHASMTRIDMVDLNRNIIETSPEFAFFNDRVFADPRVRLVHDDGRAFLNVTDQRYDLITSEPPPPLMHGISRLYSAEYYAAALEHLTPRGAMSQWLPIYQMPPAAADYILRTFVQAFPHVVLVTGWDTELVLIGSPSPLDWAEAARRFDADPRVRADLHDIGVPGPEHMIARIVMTDAQLRERFGHGEVVSDQHNQLGSYWATPQGHDLPLEPARVFELLPADLLDGPLDLRSAYASADALLRVVPDFPLDSLASAFPGVEWDEIARLNRSAEEKIGRGAPVEALADLERSLALLPSQLSIYQKLGGYFLQAGLPDSGLAWIERGLALFPDVQDLRLTKAAALQRMGRVQDAAAELQIVLTANPRCFDAHTMMGELMVSANRSDLARQHLQAALELKPMARGLRQRLKALRP